MLHERRTTPPDYILGILSMNSNKAHILACLTTAALLFTGCAIASKKGESITLVVDEIKHDCGKAGRQCLLLTVKNHGPTPIEFAIDGDAKRAALAEPAYTYQGLRKDRPEWEDLAISVGSYTAPNKYLALKAGESRRVEAYFPGQMPTAWLYERFRLGITDRAGARYFTHEFDSTGRAIKSSPQG